MTTKKDVMKGHDGLTEDILDRLADAFSSGRGEGITIFDKHLITADPDLLAAYEAAVEFISSGEGRDDKRMAILARQ